MLKTDYKDDILNTDVNVNRKFNIVRSNGTLVEQNVELRETTAFKQVGDSFGAKDINETNKAIVDVAERLQTEVDNVSTKFQNLQIGGRNLLTNSKGEFSCSYPTSDYIDLFKIDVALPTGATHFVLSFDAKSTVTGDEIISHFLNPSNIIKSENSVGEILTIDDGRTYTKLTNDWNRYWVKWTAPIADSRTVIVARMVSSEGSGTVSIRNIKLEVGTVPTDWTPAPEDLIDTSIPNYDIDTILNS